MSSRSERKQALVEGRRGVKAELIVSPGRTKVALDVLKFGFHVVVERADVDHLVFFEASEKLEINLKAGSKVVLRCTLDGAQALAVKLLPEERDNCFWFHAKNGDRLCAWDDLR